ncbi:MAG: glycosyltransferase family protein [Solirubrobacterales bacterium]|nr:glycosyltransferase family protein [Solirubrobacterales bacterium]
MIAFGCAITETGKWDRYARPGIDLVKEPDSRVFGQQTTNSLFRNYNLLLDTAGEIEDLEALVLLHQDAEIVDPDFCAKVRRALEDPAVGLIGAAGAVGVRSIAWWEGAVTWASFSHRYTEHGGGQFDADSFIPETTPSWCETGEVDSVDGFLMVLSPQVVRTLRFDESLGKLHGYDLDFCLQVREAGFKVVVEDITAIHHHSLDLVSNVDTWVTAHIALTEKWEGRMPGIGDGPADWKLRARKAEAEASAERTQAHSTGMLYQAAKAELETMRNSLSWRITAPLRAPRAFFKRRRKN